MNSSRLLSPSWPYRRKAHSSYAETPTETLATSLPFHALLEDGSLIDLGASQQLAQKIMPEYTCQAKLGGSETRRDYIFVNPAGLDTIQRVEVHTIAGIPTHRAVHAVANFDLNGPETKPLQMPSHAAELFDEAVAAELTQTQEATSDHSK